MLTTSKGGVVPYGRPLSLQDLAQAWGFPEAVSTKLSEIADEFGVLIGARSRQAISTKLEALGAVWKNSNFHQKTISAIDRAYLRMNIEQGLLGTRTFTAAGTADAIKAIRSAGLTPGQEAEALARLASRIKEGGHDLDKLKQLAGAKRKACSTCPVTEGWVNAGFNATESGLKAAPTSVDRWRRFQLVETPILAEDGTVLGALYEPLEENVAYASAPKLGKEIPPLCKEVKAFKTVLCPITGDIDLVYITDLFGASLGPDLMQKVFRALEAAGFAHTDLVTWEEQQGGAFFFPGKIDQLEGLTPGNEATAQFAPHGVRQATYIDALHKSVETGPNSYQLTILGGATPPTR